MDDPIVSSCFKVAGIRDDNDVKAALQSLYDAFADLGLGQATFEITEQGTQVWVKHQASVTPDREAIDAALRRAGEFSLAD